MTKRHRRTFSSEFKLDAASLVLDQGYSIAEAARSGAVRTDGIDVIGVENS